MANPAKASGAGAPVRKLDWTSLVWTSLTLVGAILLHIDHSPLWVSGVALALIAWRLAAAVRAVPLPGKFARPLLAFLLVGLVFLRFHTLNGLSAGTLLLVLMAAIKLLETQARRDEYIVVGGSLFLLLAACLDRQSLLRAPLYLLQTWLCCGALAIIAYSPEGPATASQAAPVGLSTRGALLLAGRTLLYSLPLAVVLFLFFPRLAGAFWSVPRSDEAETGLSDSMSPGSISQLTSSYDIAFRVKFEGAPPPPRERYWRGPVLHNFDGYTWRRAPGPTYRAQALEYLGTGYHYRVSLEPSQQRWWFSLDTVDHSPDPKVSMTYDYELVSQDPVTEPTSYDAVSHTATHAVGPLSALARQVETTVVEDRNRRTLQLAREMRQRVASDGAYIDAVLNMLRTGGFVYSLTPPLLSYDSVDDFLFNTRSGFCGHYASAFVTLMRDAGVPARVVTGYLGGEWNPIGGYFIVRQSDAHSWAEVWLDGHGWTRVDPTAVVEPDRLTRGMLDLLPEAGSTEARLVRASPGLLHLMQRWDAVNAWWNDHVLKFDYRSQLRLLSRLGIGSPDLTALAWAFVAALLTWLGWIAWQFGRAPSRPRPDRLARAYARLCGKLARVGLPPRLAYQGPLAYADVVSSTRPDLASAAGFLLARYAELRYGAPRASSRAQDIAGFEREVTRFRAHPRSP
jgi:protein-glutamine gamma-glutamyltransferase